MKTSNQILATTLLAGKAVYSESFQVSAPFIQKRSLVATQKYALDQPLPNLGPSMRNNYGGLYATSKQSNEGSIAVEKKTQENGKKLDEEEDTNPLNKILASFNFDELMTSSPFKFDLDEFMASLPFNFDKNKAEVRICDFYLFMHIGNNFQ